MQNVLGMNLIESIYCKSSPEELEAPKMLEVEESNGTKFLKKES
jgi:hypothetical protein